jgi:hypothetical protein
MEESEMLFSKKMDEIKFSDIEAFCSLDSPEEQRPHEGLRIDFKSSFPNDLPKFLVAFANTSGGIILLGVEENQGVPQKIVGVPLGKADIKTRITEIAYSAINPPLVPEVGLARMPNDDSKGVVVVRIQESQYPPHMVESGSENSIYVRVNDECQKADLRTIEALLAKRKSATETFSNLVSVYGDVVDLEWLFEKGFRAISVIPEISREDMIVFNRQMDWFFMENKPDLVWSGTPITSIRGGVIFRRKTESPAGKNEFRFSVMQQGVINFSETLWDWENGFGLDRTITVLVKILNYAKMIYERFGYFGTAQVRLRAGRVQGKTLTKGGSPLRSSPLDEYKAVTNDISEIISFWIEDIQEQNPEPCLSLVSNFIRGLFNLAVDEGLIHSLIKRGHKPE